MCAEEGTFEMCVGQRCSPEIGVCQINAIGAKKRVPPIFRLHRFDAVDSLHHVPLPATHCALNRAELEALLGELYGEVATLKQTVAELREEIARLKGLKGRPNIKPSGMETGATPPKAQQQGKQPGRGKVTPRVKVEEEVIRVEILLGSIFKGHEPFLVQDLVISAKATCYLRERWITPDGRTIVAPLPQGIAGHFGPELAPNGWCINSTHSTTSIAPLRREFAA